MAYVRPDMDGYWSSQDVMKVQPDPDRIPPGYLNAFLSSRFGVPIIVSQAYGAIIQHIEPHHIADFPVPRFDSEIEQSIHDLVQGAADLRAQFQVGVVAATEDLFTTAGLSELLDLRWHEQERDLGFDQRGLTPTTLRALNFQPRAHRILDKLRTIPHATLGDICVGGSLKTGSRFRRIDADPSHGVRLIGQRHAFWIRPEGRWISAAQAPADILMGADTVLIAAHGTLGENEVYARSILVTGSWHEHAFSQDFVRVRPGDDQFPGHQGGHRQPGQEP